MSESTGVEVTRDEARRIAVRSQLLDGSAANVLDTVRRLRYLQLDPISTVAPPQHLVLFSRLGHAYDRAELDRLLWEERKLIEWRAFLWPAEDLPYLQARMRRRSPRGLEYIKENSGFRRYVLRELDRRGPLLSREIETHSSMNLDRHDWWGTRKVGLMLEVLTARGEVAVVGRRGKQRVWDLAERWYPESATLPWAQAEKQAEERRRRALGVVLDKRKGRWLAHPDATDGPVTDRAILLSPFDRLIHDRERAEALWDFFYRLEMYVPKAKREYGYYVLPLLVGDQLVGRAEPVFDAKSKTLRVLGAWGDTSRLPEALDDLAAWLGAERVEG
jgi:uncharacterized protein YcaQ